MLCVAPPAGYVKPKRAATRQPCGSGDGGEREQRHLVAPSRSQPLNLSQPTLVSSSCSSSSSSSQERSSSLRRQHTFPPSAASSSASSAASGSLVAQYRLPDTAVLGAFPSAAGGAGLYTYPASHAMEQLLSHHHSNGAASILGHHGNGISAAASSSSSSSISTGSPSHRNPPPSSSSGLHYAPSLLKDSLGGVGVGVGGVGVHPLPLPVVSQYQPMPSFPALPYATAGPLGGVRSEAGGATAAGYGGAYQLPSPRRLAQYPYL
ncbi:uncharacterized protein LOC134443971 [Engraulis encrasicolus]|uniref:uncharacterized protein LOC134443971 n=1 Tax=Engraulis encrasicolus TaxID=184585 RepID=UPI002FD79000